MGSTTPAPATLPLWQRYRAQFPVCESLVYLNHAGVAPLCRPAAEAMQHLAADCLNFGSLHYDQWMAAYEGVRTATARLVNCDRAEVALVKNTSEGIATIAMGLDWKPGDKMVGFREEFPAKSSITPVLPPDYAFRRGKQPVECLSARGGPAIERWRSPGQLLRRRCENPARQERGPPWQLQGHCESESGQGAEARWLEGCPGGRGKQRRDSGRPRHRS